MQQVAAQVEAALVAAHESVNAHGRAQRRAASLGEPSGHPADGPSWGYLDAYALAMVSVVALQEVGAAVVAMCECRLDFA